MQIGFSHLLESLTFFKDLFFSFYSLCICSFYLNARYLYSFCRSLFLVFIFLCLFLLLVYFCIFFLWALPSYVACTDCVSYFLLSIAWGKCDIMWLWDVSEVLARSQAMGILSAGLIPPPPASPRHVILSSSPEIYFLPKDYFSPKPAQ